MYGSKYAKIAFLIYFTVRIARINLPIVHYEHSFAMLVYRMKIRWRFQNPATPVFECYCHFHAPALLIFSISV